MKRMLLFSIVLLAVFLVTACGGAAPTATSTQPAATQTQLPPTATETPLPPTATESAAPETIATEPPATEAPTQSTPAEGIPQTGNGTQINVTLADNSLSPSMFTFQVGVPYTFVITNRGDSPHNFNINPPVSKVGTVQGAMNNVLLTIPEEKLEPGESVTVQFTFPESAAGKQWEFACLNKRHYEDGMHVAINVVK